MLPVDTKKTIFSFNNSLSVFLLKVKFPVTAIKVLFSIPSKKSLSITKSPANDLTAVNSKSHFVSIPFENTGL